MGGNRSKEVILLRKYGAWEASDTEKVQLGAKSTRGIYYQYE